MGENKEVRERQNQRRAQSGEPVTLESMLRDLTEEAEAESTDPEQREQLKDVLDLERRTRGL